LLDITQPELAEAAGLGLAIVAIAVLRDGTIRGGTSFFYFVGTYSCSDGKWKGEMTNQEHSQAPVTRPMAGRVVSIGFSGTYTDEVPKPGVHHSSASEVFDTMQSFGYW
jgi:hypothetical protein